jgi:hypothetical protein
VVCVIQTYYVSQDCNLSVTVKPKALGDNCFKTKRVGLTVTTEKENEGTGRHAEGAAKEEVREKARGSRNGSGVAPLFEC